MANQVRIEFVEQGDECMRDAIMMANVYMNSPNSYSFNSILAGFFEIDRQTLANQLKRVIFQYVRHENCYKEDNDNEDDERLAETDPDIGLDNLTIYISDFFPRRIQRAGLNRAHNEYRFLIFGMSVSILHETVHLMNRWVGHKETPIIHQLEAGFFLERRLFGNVIKLAYRPNRQDPAAREVIGIAIEEGTDVYLVRQKWIDYLFDHVFNSIPMPMHTRIEVPVIDLMDPSKREGLEFRSVESISKNPLTLNSNIPILTTSRCNRNKNKKSN